MNSYKEKCEGLKRAMDGYTKEAVIVAFSGGADSSLLLKLACESAKIKEKKVYAVTVHTTLHPTKDMEIAKEVAAATGAEHIILQVDELQNAGIANNPVNRCYLCKKYIFEKIKIVAKEKGVKIILEGTNEDDLHVYRPGIKALKELNIISPLADATMKKEEVRRLAEAYKISVAQRPAAPCLATRFPYGTLLSYESMRQVECGEEWIRNLGFYNVRLRVHGDILRVEVDENALMEFVLKKNQIIDYLKQLGFSYITLDIEGFRSGSMDYLVETHS